MTRKHKMAAMNAQAEQANLEGFDLTLCRLEISGDPKVTQGLYTGSMKQLMRVLRTKVATIERLRAKLQALQPGLPIKDFDARN